MPCPTLSKCQQWLSDEKNRQEDSELHVDAVETIATILDSDASNQDKDQAKLLGHGGDLENNSDQGEAAEVHGQEEKYR